MSYQHPTIHEEDTVVPLVTIIIPPTTTTTRSYRVSKWRGMVALVAGMMMLLVVVAGTVWMGPEGALSDHSFGSLGGPLPNPTHYNGPCLPPGGTFNGISLVTVHTQIDPYETCFQLSNTRPPTVGPSRTNVVGFFCTCAPNGLDGKEAWHIIDAKYVMNPITHPHSCGDPCQGQHQQ